MPRTLDGNPQVPPLRHGEGWDQLVLGGGSRPAALHGEHGDALAQYPGNLSERAAAHDNAAARLRHARQRVLNVRADVEHYVLADDVEHPVPYRAAEFAGPFLGAVRGGRSGQALRYLNDEHVQKSINRENECSFIHTVILLCFRLVVVREIQCNMLVQWNVTAGW